MGVGGGGTRAGGEGEGGSGGNGKESGEVAVTDHPEVPVSRQQPAHTWRQRDSTAFRPAQQQKTAC